MTGPGWRYPTGAVPRSAQSSARAGRRTNLALLVVLAGAFLTGWLAFAAGTAPCRRGWPRSATACSVSACSSSCPGRPSSSAGRRCSGWPVWLLAGVIVVCLAAGFVEVFVGYGCSPG